MGILRGSNTSLITIAFLSAMLPYKLSSAQSSNAQGYNPSVLNAATVVICPGGYSFQASPPDNRNNGGHPPCVAPDPHSPGYIFSDGTPILDWINQTWIADLQSKLFAQQQLSNDFQVKIDEQAKLLKAEAYAIADMEKRLSNLEFHRK